MHKALDSSDLYWAKFELSDAVVRVAAGTVNRASGAWLHSLINGSFERFAIRLIFESNDVHVQWLLPLVANEPPPLLAQQLDRMDSMAWCRSAVAFDKLYQQLGSVRHWFDTSEHTVRGLPFLVEASLLPDIESLRSQSASGPVALQVNAWRQPPDLDETRQLRKHLARLELLTGGLDFPQERLAVQRSMIERRLIGSWVTDEVLATTTAAQATAAMGALKQRLHGLGGPTLPDSIIQTGDFEELLLTGLNSAFFIEQGALARACRTPDLELLSRVLLKGRSSVSEHPTSKHHDVFISHASAEATNAQKVCEALEARGLRCWLAPRDIPPGTHYADVIESAVAQSATLLVLLSEASAGSVHVLREIERSVHHRLRIVPVRLEDVALQGALAYLLSGCQWIDMVDGFDASTTAQQLL